ncbi:I78 family peptidase inhibitor [Sphingomonas qilianensis]|uniref:I78 family peptidase inhibitor n=1 Tax=Sphingomonas qilianensis TaxID=1736690 RepID=A0ABU9XM48_9SPHN
MKLGIVAPALVLFAGCAQHHPAPLPAPIGVCQAAPVQRFVGQQATPALLGEVQRISGAATARRITPEMRVTMEYSDARVNVWVGLKGEAERITCG